MLRNVAALRHLQQGMVGDYLPNSPIMKSDMAQDVQVQARTGGNAFDHTSLQMHRRDGCCMYKACTEQDRTTLCGANEWKLVTMNSSRGFGCLIAG